MSVRSRPTVRAGRLGLPTANDLAAEIDRLKSEPSLAGYDEKVRFVLWFLLAYATADDVAAAKGALTGVPGTKERDVDALHIDRRTDGLSVVYVVQGKYREAVLKGGEVGKDVSSFTALGKVLRSASRQEFDSYCDPKLMDELTRRKLEEARGLLLKSRGSLLRLCYVSLSKIGAGVRESATKQLAGVPRTELVAFDGMKTLRLLETYLDGVQRVNDFTLQVADDGTAFFEHDAGGLRTWVFTAEATSVAQWFELEKERLFASNVRGYEGDSRRSDLGRGNGKSVVEVPEPLWMILE